MRSIGKGEQESSLSVKQEFKLAYKDYSRESVVSPRRKTVQKTRKLAVVAARLGAWEKATLSCIQEMKVEYQFMIADVVRCLERHGLPNPGNYLNRRIHDAVRRLVNRGIVVKGEDRGIYALRRDLARLSVERFLVFPSVDSLVSRLGSKLKGFIKQKPSEGTETDWGGAGVFGGGLASVLYNGVGGFGVLRFHVVGAGSQLDVFDAELFLYYWLQRSVRDGRRFFASLYGVSFVRSRVSAIRRLAYEAYEHAKVVQGCHGRPGDRPGGFSPLSPDCVGYGREFGKDWDMPWPFVERVRGVLRHVKVYVKGPFSEDPYSDGYVPGLPPNTLPITEFLSGGHGSIGGL